VDVQRCVACGLCADVCPQVGGNEFDVGLKARKAIYRPFPQSVPAAYVIDRDACLNDRILVCGHCTAACDVDAIDFDQQPVDLERRVGAVVVAVGFAEFDARQLGAYGYGRLPDVVTSLELERMLNPTGVTGGHVVRPSDGRTPERIIFVQCVGARGEGGHPYCSRFCCMNAVKDSLLVRQHDPGVREVTILHTDLRAFGKGFDDFLRRAREQNAARYLRGRPSRILPNPAGGGSLQVLVENTRDGRPERIEADLVVLSVAATPNEGAEQLAERLGIETDAYGFVARRDPAVSAVETTREGVFVCGSAVGPQVIPDCVAQASAAAARAQLFVAGRRVEDAQDPPEPMDLSGPPRVGVLVCRCGVNVAGVLDVADLAARAAQLSDVVVARDDLFACSTTGQDALLELIREHRLNRVVVAACTPRTHEPVFRQACASIGFNPYLLEMVNIRDQCAWVHSRHPLSAQAKAHDLIRMGVARARRLMPLHAGEAPMERAALVVGGGLAGIQAATDLAVQGYPVTLVERSERLGGRLAAPDLHLLYPNLRPAAEVLAKKLEQLEASGATVLTETEVAELSGFVGSFEVRLKGRHAQTQRCGALILATGAELSDPGERYGFGRLPNVVTSLQLEQALCAGEGQLHAAPRSAAFLLCVGSRDPQAGYSGCSRYCCPTAIKQALLLQRQGVDCTVFHRDVRTVSTGAEELYRQARAEGVLFVRVPPEQRAEVVGQQRVEAVRCYDELLGRFLEVEAELVVLSVGMRPRQPETAFFHDQLKASLGPDGFFLERHPELAPVETSVEGVFLAGTVQGPKDLVDTVAQASAAAAKASVLLAHDVVRQDPAVATVDPERCRACGQCVPVCPYQAPELRRDSSGATAAHIHAALCKGCGTCAAWCPSGAIVALHFTNGQINAMIDAVFDGEVAS